MKKPVPEPAVLLKWLPMTWVWERLTLIPPVLRSVRRRALQILPVCWEECMRVSSTVDMVQEIVEELAKYAGVPVWNGLTNEFHPTQILADMLTIREHFGNLDVKVVYMGDARYNMGNSWMVGCAKMGMDFTACAPKKYWPSQELIDQCQEIAKETGAKITLEEDVEKATKNADVIYTDVWVSMGEPDEVWAERIHDLLPYQVNKAVMENAGEQAIFMHCLPAFHDLGTKIGKQISEKFNLDAMEVTDEVFESSQSVVFDEAENRMHTIKAVMAATLGA